MQTKPHFITSPKDSSSWDFRQDCMAWELYTKKTPIERAEFIKAQKPLQSPEFTARLQRCQAWWMLAYLTRHQINSDLNAMPLQEANTMRDQLNNMTREIKIHRQIEHKTFMGKTTNA